MPQRVDNIAIGPTKTHSSGVGIGGLSARHRDHRGYHHRSAVGRVTNRSAGAGLTRLLVHRCSIPNAKWSASWLLLSHAQRPTAVNAGSSRWPLNTATIAILEHNADEQLARSAKILRQLSANLLEAFQKSNAATSRELHDEPGQTLTATKKPAGKRQHDPPTAAAP